MSEDERSEEEFEEERGNSNHIAPGRHFTPHLSGGSHLNRYYYVMSKCKACFDWS